MKLSEFLTALHDADPDATFRIQFGSEVRMYKIETVFEDGILCNDGDIYRSFPLSAISIEPMIQGARYPGLTEKVLREANL
jgi:hypothetical protein